jgi:hypothetical protein
MTLALRVAMAGSSLRDDTRALLTYLTFGMTLAPHRDDTRARPLIFGMTLAPRRDNSRAPFGMTLAKASG